MVERIALKNKMRRMLSKESCGVLAIVLLLCACYHEIIAATGGEVQERITNDARRGDPIVGHIVVALCDNKYQGIVRVPERLGNGQDPGNNLYWGAAYGVHAYLSRKAGWSIVPTAKASHGAILERVVLRGRVHQKESDREVFLVADAWDGKEIKAATKRFLAMAAGHHAEVVEIEREGKPLRLQAGGSAHLIAYVGHNGLMDFSLRRVRRPLSGAPARSSVVLACASEPYFKERLKKCGSHPLLLTTGRLAPEAYTLDAVIRSWFAGRSVHDVRDAAAAAYNKYQKCGLDGARRLFSVEP